MENINLFLLRILLASVILSLVTAYKTQDNHEPTSVTEQTHEYNHIKPSLHTPKHLQKAKHNKHAKKSKKSKRDAYGNYGKYWASKSSNYGYGESSSNLPLYLVYNRKVGAYYPYYKYPKESIRRSGHMRRVPEQ